MTDLAQSLISLLNALGARQSNPVLEVIGSDTSIVLARKYPADSHYLGNRNWHAFYHCHDSLDKPEHEHGHFHIFINADNDSDSSHWPHLAGLSMDYMGQPRQWFTVNQWVTGGNWLNSEKLTEGILNCSVDETMSLVEKWLVCMMTFYREEIGRLLLDRDASISKLGSQRDKPDMMKDRDIYTLSLQAIDLQKKLEATFLDDSSQNIG